MASKLPWRGLSVEALLYAGEAQTSRVLASRSLTECLLPLRGAVFPCFELRPNIVERVVLNWVEVNSVLLDINWYW
jgi:hypothetical protein